MPSHLGGQLSLAVPLLASLCVSVVDAACFEDQFGNVTCEPVIRPAAAFGISIGIFVIVIILFSLLARRRRDRMRAANLVYIQSHPQQGYPPTPYAPPYGTPYAPPYAPPYGPPPDAGLGYSPDHHHNKDVPPENAPQYPPPSYIAP